MVDRYDIENDFAAQKEFDATQEGIILSLASQNAALEQRVKELESKYLNAENSATFFKAALEEANAVNDRLTVQVKELEAELEICKHQNTQIAYKKLQQENMNLMAKCLSSECETLSTLRTKNERLVVRLKKNAESYSVLIAQLHLDVAARDGEIVRLREVLQKISVWGCSGHCVDLCGSKCPCCMAEEALGGGE